MIINLYVYTDILKTQGLPVLSHGLTAPTVVKIGTTQVYFGYVIFPYLGGHIFLAM